MIRVERDWAIGIPELLGLTDAGLDDIGADAAGDAYVSDGVNGQVYRFGSGGVMSDSFPVIKPGQRRGVSSLNIAISDDSLIYAADFATERVVRYDERGRYLGEFPVGRVLSLCSGPEGIVYALVHDDGSMLVKSYDQMGYEIGSLEAPPMPGSRPDPSLVNLDADADGNVYVSYGMPPYSIWRVAVDGSGFEAWGREIDYPEGVVLVSDISVDCESGVLWALLACREMGGHQLLDAFAPDGAHLATVHIPPSDNLYSLMCAAGSGLYLLDTDAEPGAGNLVRLTISM